MMPRSIFSPVIASCASGSRSDLNWYTLSPFSCAAARRGSALAPGFSGAQNTPATSSPRARNASRTALPKSCCPMIAIFMVVIRSSLLVARLTINERRETSHFLLGRLRRFLWRHRECPRALQLCDAFLAVAEHLFQDFLGVLAEQRRALDSRGRVL